MESLSHLANNYSLTPNRTHKYSTEQLAEIEALFNRFDVHDLFKSKTKQTEPECLQFLAGGIEANG
jgi:hypothetical protein